MADIKESQETIALMYDLMRGVESYISDYGEDSAFDESLVKKMNDLTIEEGEDDPDLLKTSDVWGNDFAYEKEGSLYKLLSKGDDGQLGTRDDIELSLNFEITPVKYTQKIDDESYVNSSDFPFLSIFLLIGFVFMISLLLYLRKREQERKKILDSEEKKREKEHDEKTILFGGDIS